MITETKKGKNYYLSIQHMFVNGFRGITMIGHLGINVTDLKRAKVYYDTLMPLLEFEPFLSRSDQFAYRPANEKRETERS